LSHIHLLQVSRSLSLYLLQVSKYLSSCVLTTSSSSTKYFDKQDSETLLTTSFCDSTFGLCLGIMHVPQDSSCALFLHGQCLPGLDEMKEKLERSCRKHRLYCRWNYSNQLYCRHNRLYCRNNFKNRS